jgi:RNA polymerase sigma-70 factor (ECF subfamily)
MPAHADLDDDFDAFYRAHLDLVLAYCSARMPSPDLAADVAAEVFAAALIGWRRYRRERGTPLQWLLGIAAKKIADTHRRGSVERRAQRRLGIPPIVWTDADLDRVTSLGDDSGVLAMLSELPARQRSAVEAHVVRDRPYAQIAETEGVSEAVIRKRVSRGLASLRERLGTREQGS